VLTAASKSKVRDLEISLREVEAGGRSSNDNEYAISQKLAYETGAHRSVEAEFDVVLKSLWSDQINCRV
jgi:hypothetical protein